MKKKLRHAFAGLFTLSLLFASVPARAAEIGAASGFESGEWYQNTRLIAHALGIVDNKAGTNSKEAFLQSYNSGFLVLEADFAVTRDGVLVVRHDFEQDSYYTLEQVVQNGDTSMDIERYRSEKICFRYTPLTAKDLLLLMADHDGIYIVTDTKDTDIPSVTRDFQLLVADANAIGRPDLLERFIVQIYNDEMLSVVKEVYPFQNWIYTLYQTKDPDYDRIADFCVQNGIDVVTMNYEVLTPERISAITSRGLSVFTHTVNSVLHLKKYVEMGVQGVYTDTIQPYELEYIGLAHKKNTVVPLYCEKKTTNVEAYPINGKNYYNIKSIAKILMNTDSKFNIRIEEEAGTILLEKGADYTLDGSETIVTNGFGIIRENPLKLMLGDTEIPIESYFIGGNYYYPLEELASALGCKVSWNGIYAVTEITPEQKPVKQESKEAKKS